MDPDLLRLWLTESAERIEKRETRVRAESLSRLANERTAYAMAMSRLADAHRDAAAVYRRALEESESQ